MNITLRIFIVATLALPALTLASDAADMARAAKTVKLLHTSDYIRVVPSYNNQEWARQNLVESSLIFSGTRSISNKIWSRLENYKDNNPMPQDVALKLDIFMKNLDKIILELEQERLLREKKHNETSAK